MPGSASPMRLKVVTTRYRLPRPSVVLIRDLWRVQMDTQDVLSCTRIRQTNARTIQKTAMPASSVQIWFLVR
jgi:hypothetical protein